MNKPRFACTRLLAGQREDTGEFPILLWFLIFLFFFFS
jgi:hypothetical protein